MAHVEAGLRSFDRTILEEVNCLLNDQPSDLLFTPPEDGNQSLMREGIASEEIDLVGNVMIDTLIRLLPRAIQRVPSDLPRPFGLLTLHRPSNVDDPDVLIPILHTLLEFSREIDILFPVHSRTRQRLNQFGLLPGTGSKLHLLEPLPYLEFLGLQYSAKFVVTDSGGIQEETTFLGIPCLTVRDNTERPVTISHGSNILVGRDLRLLASEIRRILAGQTKVGGKPDLWDGKAGERIADSLVYRAKRALVASSS